MTHTEARWIRDILDNTNELKRIAYLLDIIARQMVEKNKADIPQTDRNERVTADDRWTWNFDVYDESDAPTTEGYYRTIDDEGNEITDYYFNEPRLTEHGYGYWKYGTRPITAWKYLGEEVADTPQTEERSDYGEVLQSADEQHGCA